MLAFTENVKIFTDTILRRIRKKKINKLICSETQNMHINHRGGEMAPGNFQEIFSLTPYFLSIRLF